MKALVTKLVRIMSNTKRVAKNGTNTFHQYSYATEADVLDAVRDNLAKENVFIFSSVEGSHWEKDTNTTTVKMKHTFVDGESGEEFEVNSLGQGQDKGDKGANKAVTAAIKYMLMKNLLIPTGDDPEATDENGKSTKTELKSVPKKTYGFANKTKATTNTTTEATPVVAKASDEF